MSSSKRPSGDPFSQQALPDWGFEFGKREWIQLYYFLTLVMFVLGGVFAVEYARYKEWELIYDGVGMTETDCQISSANEGLQCSVSITFDEGVNGPLYVHYGLTNFFQNNRRYKKSVLTDMLVGSDTIDEDDLALDCYPLIYNGTRQLYPCGLQANTYFNDVYSVSNVSTVTSTVLDTDGITYSTESENGKFSQVNGFVYSHYFGNETCDDILGDTSYLTDCQSYTDDTGQAYYYWYPNTDKYQYLYETFPQINPILGVEDESFIVWMRTSPFASFRKPIGKIDTDVNAGEVLEFTIENNYDVNSFGGSKSIVVANLPVDEVLYLRAFWVVSFTLGCLFFATGTALLYKMNPAFQLHQFRELFLWVHN
jgi:hypothetical protein